MDIFVTNHNDFDHQDRYDGQDFFFPRGERVTIPMIVAQHCFGLGLTDKTDNLIRLGWANNEDGIKRLANFVFTQGIMVEAPVEDQPDLLTAPKSTVLGEMAPAR